MIESIYKIYLMLNVGIIISFILSKTMIYLFNSKYSQMTKLRFVRKNFLLIIGALIFFSWFLHFIENFYHSNFQFQPLLKSSIYLLQNADLVRFTPTPLITPTKVFPIEYVVYGFLFLGLVLSLFKYLKSIYLLNKLKNESITLHKISAINILVSHEVTVPFCWSFFKNHFIVLPIFYVEKNRDLKIAIHHELQHIRQGDTQWRHILAIIKIFYFYNPFIYLFINMADELQEFACDEALILSKKTQPLEYAECLFDSAKSTLENKMTAEFAVGINILPKSILYRRISMMFHYKMLKKAKSYLAAYIFSFVFAITTSFALNGFMKNVNAHDVNQMILQANLDSTMHIVATPLLVNTLNTILHDPKAKKDMKAALQRMKSYQPLIDNALQENNIPNEFIALPFIESGFQPLKQEQNAMQAAGIWQIIPSTGKNLGLTINSEQDDRLNAKLATGAAIKLLKQNYQQFQDWKLALISYEIGENKTDQLLKTTNTKDATALMHAKNTPDDVKKFVATFEASVLIIHHPSLLN